MRTSQSIGDTQSDTANAVLDVCSSSRISPPHPHYDVLSTSPSSFNSSPRVFSFQQSILFLIHLHLLKHLSNPPEDEVLRYPQRCLLSLKQGFTTFLHHCGYVSQRFLETAVLAVKEFFRTNTFHIVSEDLPELFSLASLFDSEIQSVFVNAFDFKVENFISYSHVITGLRVFFADPNDLDFLYKSSDFFPCLKELNLYVQRSVFVKFIDVMKVTDTVTSACLSMCSIGPQGVIALADALKVNTSVTSINLNRNSVRDEGARAIADALKINSTLTSIDLSDNSIDVEGAIALADALTENTSVTSINLSGNSIRDEGARAMADLLTVSATITSIDLSHNCIGYKGARELSTALQVNDMVTNINLGLNPIGEKYAKTLTNTHSNTTKHVVVCQPCLPLITDSQDRLFGLDNSTIAVLVVVVIFLELWKRFSNRESS
ncbi:hypothetical protein GEMRC1_000608 [Eukaryota sp. GEM-RC1]